MRRPYYNCCFEGEKTRIYKVGSFRESHIGLEKIRKKFEESKGRKTKECEIM
jgi:hypothetical protein